MIDTEKYEANKEFISPNVLKIERIGERIFVYDKKIYVEILHDGYLSFKKSGKVFNPQLAKMLTISVALRHFLQLQVDLDEELIEKMHIMKGIR